MASTAILHTARQLWRSGVYREIQRVKFRGPEWVGDINDSVGGRSGRCGLEVKGKTVYVAAESADGVKGEPILRALWPVAVGQSVKYEFIHIPDGARRDMDVFTVNIDTVFGL
jgi:hypothetical protein